MNFINVTNNVPIWRIDYSEVPQIVDLSSFMPDAEQVRSLKFNPAGERTTPTYDYNDGVVPDNDTVTPELIALRSGRLDKADIDNIKKSIYKDSKDEMDSKRSEKMLEAVEKQLGLSDSENKKNV